MLRFINVIATSGSSNSMVQLTRAELLIESLSLGIFCYHFLGMSFRVRATSACVQDSSCRIVAHAAKAGANGIAEQVTECVITLFSFYAATRTR